MRDDEHEGALGPVTGAVGARPVVAAQTKRADDDVDFELLARQFLSKVSRLRGVKIDREAFLRQELRKAGLDSEMISHAIEKTPIEAGVRLMVLDEIGRSAFAFETSKSAALSFAAGLPGGFAMFASVPADITQFYVHAFRVMQKLAYVYGWKDFIEDLEEVDDHTLGRLTLFLGVMMGVNGAATNLSRFSSQIARPAIQKQIAAQALTKTAWYEPMKQVLKVVGVNVTKDSFAKTVTKAIPLAGGVVSGGATLLTLRVQSERLQAHLRLLPPPTVDSAEFSELVRGAQGRKWKPGRMARANDAVNRALDGSVTHARKSAGDAGRSLASGGDRALRKAGSILGKSSPSAGGTDENESVDKVGE